MMKRASVLLLVGIFLAAGGCSSSNPSGPGPAANAADAAVASAPPPAPTPETAKPLVVRYVEGAGPLKDLSQFLKLRPDLATASPTVIIEKIQVNRYDDERGCFPVEADLVLGKRVRGGEVERLEGARASKSGFPSIPGTWKFDFKPSGKDKWEVELRK